MECPYCGAENSLLWDEGRGTVVCSECGTVVDSIYVNGGSSGHGLEPPEGPKGRGRTVSRSLGRLSDASLKYLEILEEIRGRPMLYVDSDSFGRYLALGKRVKVVRRRSCLPRSETLDRILAVMVKYPRLCSRTDRAKYAIAVIAYALATEGFADVPALSRGLGLSKTHVRRLLRVVRSSREFLCEVRGVAQAAPAGPAEGGLAQVLPALASSAR